MTLSLPPPVAGRPLHCVLGIRDFLLRWIGRSPSLLGDQFLINALIAGCGGSKDDVRSDQSRIKIRYYFRCSELPADLNDPLIRQLCH